MKYLMKKEDTSLHVLLINVAFTLDATVTLTLFS